MKVSDFLDATLVAKKPVIVYTSPRGEYLRQAQTGSIVGEIYSWVELGNDIYWQLKEGGFVKHSIGAFDANKAKVTSSQYKEDLNKKLGDTSTPFDMDIIKKFLPSGNKLAIYGIIVIVLLFILNKAFK